MPDHAPSAHPSGHQADSADVGCCARAGEIIVLPRAGGAGPAGARVVADLLRATQLDAEVAHSVEDVLAAYADGLVPRAPDPVAYPALPVLVRVPPGTEWESVQRLRAEAAVDAAIPNFVVRATAPAVTLDQQAIDSALAAVLGSPAPQYGCGEGVRVAVLDTGIDPDVAGRAAVDPIQLDADRPRPAGETTPFDPVGHGSVVARLVHLVAPEARLTAVKVLEESGDAMALAAGFFLAHQYVRPHVYNLSVALTRRDAARCPSCGYAARVPHTGWHVARVLGAFRDAPRLPGDPDPVFVAAAGNWTTTLPEPAAIAPTLAVGAFDPASRTQPRYSTYARVPHDRFLLAPGGDGSGRRGFASTSRRTFGADHLFGTSYAAPFVTGLAARYLCGDCGLGARATPPGRSESDIVRDCLTRSAETTFPGYNATVHGLGFARWDPTVLDRVLAGTA